MTARERDLLLTIAEAVGYICSFLSRLVLMGIPDGEQGEAVGYHFASRQGLMVGLREEMVKESAGRKRKWRKRA